MVEGPAATPSAKETEPPSAIGPTPPGQSGAELVAESAVAPGKDSASKVAALHGAAFGVHAQRVSASPSRRNLIFLGLGGLCVFAILVFALRPRSPGSSGAAASVQLSPQPSSVPAPVQPADRQSTVGRDEAPPSAAPSAASPAEPGGEDTVRVVINIRPEGARVFYRGKEVGRTPFTLELLRGERRVFEVGYPGYSTRRLVVDGEEKEISFNMTQDAK